MTLRFHGLRHVIQTDANVSSGMDLQEGCIPRGRMAVFRIVTCALEIDLLICERSMMFGAKLWPLYSAWRKSGPILQFDSQC